ncbi:MAG: hypothetical protein LBR13_07685 [Dysgonamonadaceae bacterium]|jgi:hypothetical protein|nr:hypothetical protein [Dysgonamonadaceae bacterium]
MKTSLLILAIVICANDLFCQISDDSILKREIINKDTIVWELINHNYNKNIRDSATVTVYVSDDRNYDNCPTISEIGIEKSEALIYKYTNFIFEHHDSIVSAMLDHFPQKTLNKWIQSERKDPIILSFTINQDGKLTADFAPYPPTFRRNYVCGTRT